jgi:chitosanase
MAPALTDLQKRTAQAVVNIFETGSARGDYSNVTLIPGDTGHLTYGRSQTTLASGNLYLLVKAYCAAPAAQFAGPLEAYLPKLSHCDTTLDTDLTFRTLLREAGADPVMQSEQDQFFDRIYWVPGVQAAAACGLSTALGANVVYDSFVQGSWAALRDKTNADYGATSTTGETAWVAGYVRERRDWLANNSNPALHPTVYRMDAFLLLLGQSQWDLSLPLTVRGVLVTADLFSATPPVRASAEDPSLRLLRLQSPPLEGPDVLALQQALAKAGFAAPTDGTFAASTDAAVRQAQSHYGLTLDGIVGPATRSALGL